MIVDAGALGLWSHDREPFVPPGFLSSEEETAEANRSVDLQLIGRDGAAVGKILDRSWNPNYHFDMPPAAVAELERQVAAVARERSLEARLSTLPARIP